MTDEIRQSEVPILIEDEMRRSYLDYAMSVIIGRALPDARDGLKPVHRRILYAMHELGCYYDKPYKKSARVVGDVIGKYHPHGDSAVYDALVRMAQPWNMRHLLIAGQGNFGSVDGDSPAAMRYTEARMSRLSGELLSEIAKDTVDFTKNYDDSLEEPSILPARYPNLLVNGSTGIAVGMATNIPPHNLAEVIDATILMIHDPEVDDETLMHTIPGPDFPTGGFIYGKQGVRSAFLTGRGAVTMRAKAEIEERKDGRQAIIIAELPYQVNKARLIENVAALVRDKKLEGISDLRDESDRDGMRIVFELKRNEIAEVVLNNLYKQTALQCNYGCNLLALVDGQPKLCGVRDLLSTFLDHRRQVVTRRCLFELSKAETRAHLLEGLLIALDHIDEVVRLIRASQTAIEAKEGLIAHFSLSEKQAQAILDMRLQRLTGLERDKLQAEFDALHIQIEKLKAILNDEQRLMAVIVQELQSLRDQYAEPRRTQIIDRVAELGMEDLINEEDMVVTISQEGFIKRNAADDYRAQRRGGKGKTAATTKGEDFICKMMVASTHDFLLFFSDRGRVFRKKVYEIPQGSRQARGKAIVNLLPLEKGESISATVSLRDFEDEQASIVMSTRLGVIKRSDVSSYRNIRANGIAAIKLDEGDEVVEVCIAPQHAEFILASSGGKSIRIALNDIRTVGRVSRGVLGMRLAEGEHIIAMTQIEEDACLLVASSHGFGKRTSLDEYSLQHRGGKGVFTLKTGDRNGSMIGAAVVHEDDDIMLITDTGRLMRMPVRGISQIGRNTQGVTLINCDKKEQVMALVRLQSADELVAENDNDD